MLFVNGCHKDAIGDLNAIVINSLLTKEYVQRFQMSPFLASTLKTDRFQNAPFSNLCVFISVFESSVFTAEQCERKAKTEKFCSVFM